MLRTLPPNWACSGCLILKWFIKTCVYLGRVPIPALEMTLLSLLLLPTAVKSFLHHLSLLCTNYFDSTIPVNCFQACLWDFFVLMMANNKGPWMKNWLWISVFSSFWKSLRQNPACQKRTQYSLSLWILPARTPYFTPIGSSHTFLRQCLENESVKHSFVHFYGPPQASLHSIMTFVKKYSLFSYTAVPPAGYILTLHV